MKYKIIGKPLTKDEMVEYAKADDSRLYAINEENEIEQLEIVCICINLDTKQWEFVFLQEDRFEENEPIFKTRKTAERYLKRRLK